MKSLNSWFNRIRKAEYKSTMPSCTIPGQSMTIAEVDARYRRGQLLPGPAEPPVYTGDEEYIDINKLDKVERANLALRNKERIKHVRDEMSEREMKRKKQLEEEQLKKKIDELVKAREKALDDVVK